MELQTPSIAVDRLVRFDGNGSVKAYCDVVIGGAFLLKGLRVVEGKNGQFVSMPRQQGKDGKWWDSITILTKAAKEEINHVILAAYQQDASADSAEASLARS